MRQLFHKGGAFADDERSCRLEADRLAGAPGEDAGDRHAGRELRDGRGGLHEIQALLGFQLVAVFSQRFVELEGP